MNKPKKLLIKSTYDAYPNLKPIERQRLYWFENMDYFTSSTYLNQLNLKNTKNEN